MLINAALIKNTVKQ